MSTLKNKISFFSILFGIFSVTVIMTGCGAADRMLDGPPKYDSPQSWKKGHKTVGDNYTAEESFTWYSQTSLVDITQDKLQKKLKGENTITDNEGGEENPVEKYNKLPMVNEYGQYLGIIDNPDPDHGLVVQIFQDGIEAPVLDVTLDPNQPGKHFRAKCYLLAGKYTKVLTPLSDLAEAEEMDFEITGREMDYLGTSVYWKAFGGVGDWGQRHWKKNNHHR